MTGHNDEPFEHRIRLGLQGLDDLPTSSVAHTRTLSDSFEDQHAVRRERQRRVGAIAGSMAIVAAGLTGLYGPAAATRPSPQPLPRFPPPARLWGPTRPSSHKPLPLHHCRVARVPQAQPQL